MNWLRGKKRVKARERGRAGERNRRPFRKRKRERRGRKKKHRREKKPRTMCPAGRAVIPHHLMMRSTQNDVICTTTPSVVVPINEVTAKARWLLFTGSLARSPIIPRSYACSGMFGVGVFRQWMQPPSALPGFSALPSTFASKRQKASTFTASKRWMGARLQGQQRCAGCQWNRMLLLGLDVSVLGCRVSRLPMEQDAAVASVCHHSTAIQKGHVRGWEYPHRLHT